MFHSSWHGISLQDVPGEITLSVSISGCRLRCKGCHSTETYDPKYGNLLDINKLIKANKHISCVNFYGGEWNPLQLVKELAICKEHNLKVSLFTGLTYTNVPKPLLEVLDFIKVGPYKQELGPLGTPGTNQEFIDLRKN